MRNSLSTARVCTTFCLAIFLSCPLSLFGQSDSNGFLSRATAESQGVSSETIANMLSAMDREIDSMNSVMIVRHGKVIAEAWWSPHSGKTQHAMYSMSKSFTSTAAGFAVAEGKLNIDTPVIDFFPRDLPGTLSENLKKMKVRHLLSMSCGHKDEARHDIFNLSRDPRQVKKINQDWAKIFLAHPVVYEPGTHFRYNSLGTYMVSAILQKVTGEKLIDYLKPRLFDPLHIENPYWEISPQGINKGGSGLFIKTEDMAKFGQFYLQKGKWNGKQLLPADWVNLATSRQISNGNNPDSDWAQGYCFQFWRCRHNIYRGDGAFSQFVVVIPEKDTVIASTADSGRYQDILNFYWDILLPALGDQALPENALAVQKLENVKSKLVAREGTSGSRVCKDLSIESKILGKTMKYSVYLPVGYPTTGYDYPVLYLLHGMSDDNNTWLNPQSGNLKKIADEWFKGRQSDKMIIVLPDAEVTWYMNSIDGTCRYEDYFFNELIPHIEKAYRCKTDKHNRAIAGLSMGGHGALLYAIHHPEMFRLCYAMSASVRTDEQLLAIEYQEFCRRYGVVCGKLNHQDDVAKVLPKMNWVLPMVQKMSPGQNTNVRFFLDCGKSDRFAQANRLLYAELKKRGCDAQLTIRDGDHNWNFWRQSLPLLFESISNSTASPQDKTISKRN